MYEKRFLKIDYRFTQRKAELPTHYNSGFLIYLDLLDDSVFDFVLVPIYLAMLHFVTGFLKLTSIVL